MPTLVTLSALALPDASTTLPTEFRLFAFGSNRAQKVGGPELAFVFDETSARKVMAKYADNGVDLCFDLDHQIVNGGSAFDSGKAVGWFEPSVKPDGLYASNIRWTDEGATLLKGKAYRYFSPTFLTDDDDRVVELLPVALTNWPALKKIPALVAAAARASKDPIHMKILLSALGLADDADEQLTVAAVEALKNDRNQLLALSGQSTLGDAAAAITALRAQAEQVAGLTAEVTQLRAEKALAEVDSLLDGAVKDGRLAPAKRADMVAFNAEHGTKALRTCLSMMPKLPGQDAPAVEPKTEPNNTVSLTGDELAIAKSLGIDAQAFAATKQARLSSK